MKRFSLISALTVAIAMTLGLSGAMDHHADSADDLSFTLSPSQTGTGFRSMPESRVIEIFQDRLEGFPQAEVPKLARHLLLLCQQHHFDPVFVLALIDVESSFRVKVRSPMGAVGLMQLMPATALTLSQQMGLTPDAPVGARLAAMDRALQDPFFNLKMGIQYLAWLRDHYEGLSPYFLVAAYNVGPARMDELMARKSFKPVETKKYFESIRKGMPEFRFYKKKDRLAQAEILPKRVN